MASASSITVVVAPWVAPHVALLIRCGCTGALSRQAVVDFVWRHGMRLA